MDFKDEIKKLGEKFVNKKDKVTTEEGTKTSFVLPFISILGYDSSDPSEVVPEFTADIGMKKGEKVDYAILSNEKPIIIIECKHLKEKLDVHKTQLERYFHVTDAKFAILTNGQTYRFYTDLVAPNKMDIEPFLEINITDFKEIEVLELSKFQKNRFDVNEILAEINANKINQNYTHQLTEIIKNELNQPSDSFVNFFIRKLSIGNVDAKVIEKFSPILKEILQGIIGKMAISIETEAFSDGQTLLKQSIVEKVKNLEKTANMLRMSMKYIDNDSDIENVQQIIKNLEQTTQNLRVRIKPIDNKEEAEQIDNTFFNDIKTAPTRIKVTFPDETVISERKVAETFVKTLQKIGLDKVKALDIISNGFPLVGNKKNDKNYNQYQVATDVFIMVHTDTNTKIKFLQKISDTLNLGLIIEKIG